MEAVQDGAELQRVRKGSGAVHVSFGQVEGYPSVVADGQLGLRDAPLLRDALLKAAAEQPDALVCDLRPARAERQALTVLPHVLDRIQDWPAVPLVALTEDPALARHLEQLGVARRVPVARCPEELAVVVRRCPGLLRTSARLPATVDAPAVARSLVEDTLHRWRVSRFVDVAQLIADELATNAVVHTGRSSTLWTSLTGTRIGIAVADRGPGGARPPRPPAGWGLVLVEELSDHWGVLARAQGGHVTWAVIGSGPSRFAAVPTQAAGH